MRNQILAVFAVGVLAGPGAALAFNQPVGPTSAPLPGRTMSDSGLNSSGCNGTDTSPLLGGIFERCNPDSKIAFATSQNNYDHVSKPSDTSDHKPGMFVLLGLALFASGVTRRMA